MEPIQNTTNIDGTLTLDLVDSNLEVLFNSLPVYSFKKEFTSSNSPYLKRVYKVTLDNDNHLGAILNQSASGTSNNYILDITEFQTTLNISNYSTGLYSVALVCNGQIQQSKTLAKQ